MSSPVPEALLYLLAALLGAILGSFANVCIVRLPRGESIVTPRSRCPMCGHRISWWENIPLLSFALLGGRCRGCRGRIPWRYPLVEGLSTALALLAWWFFRHPLPFLLYFCLLVIPLVIVAFIDLGHRIIPDGISIPGIPVGIAVHTLLAPRGMHLGAALDSILGAAAGGGALFLVAMAYEKLKKQEGLGGGDVKLIAMLGAFFGWKAAIFILLVSSVMGSIVGVFLMLVLRKDMKYAIPFGPFLAAAGLVQLFVGSLFRRCPGCS